MPLRESSSDRPDRRRGRDTRRPRRPRGCGGVVQPARRLTARARRHGPPPPVRDVRRSLPMSSRHRHRVLTLVVASRSGIALGVSIVGRRDPHVAGARRAARDAFGAIAGRRCAARGDVLRLARTSRRLHQAERDAAATRSARCSSARARDGRRPARAGALAAFGALAERSARRAASLSSRRSPAAGSCAARPSPGRGGRSARALRRLRDKSMRLALQPTVDCDRGRQRPYLTVRLRAAARSSWTRRPARRVPRGHEATTASCGARAAPAPRRCGRASPSCAQQYWARRRRPEFVGLLRGGVFSALCAGSRAVGTGRRARDLVRRRRSSRAALVAYGAAEGSPQRARDQLLGNDLYYACRRSPFTSRGRTTPRRASARTTAPSARSRCAARSASSSADSTGRDAEIPSRAGLRAVRELQRRSARLGVRTGGCFLRGGRFVHTRSAGAEVEGVPPDLRVVPTPVRAAHASCFFAIDWPRSVRAATAQWRPPGRTMGRSSRLCRSAEARFGCARHALRARWDVVGATGPCRRVSSGWWIATRGRFALPRGRDLDEDVVACTCRSLSGSTPSATRCSCDGHDRDDRTLDRARRRARATAPSTRCSAPQLAGDVPADPGAERDTMPLLRHEHYESWSSPARGARRRSDQEGDDDDYFSTSPARRRDEEREAPPSVVGPVGAVNRRPLSRRSLAQGRAVDGTAPAQEGEAALGGGLSALGPLGPRAETESESPPHSFVPVVYQGREAPRGSPPAALAASRGDAAMMLRRGAERERLQDTRPCPFTSRKSPSPPKRAVLLPGTISMSYCRTAGRDEAPVSRQALAGFRSTASTCLSHAGRRAVSVSSA